jgi:hypothetical protein
VGFFSRGTGRQLRQAALEGYIFDRLLSSSDFQSLVTPALMRAWQPKWDSVDTGRFAHSRCDASVLV